MNEHLLHAAVTALACLPLALALAASGLPMASAVLLFNPPKRVKVFRDKFGQQTATCALLTGLIALLGLTGGAFALHRLFPAASSFWLGWPLPLGPLAGGAALCAVLAAVYRATWQAMKDQRALHAGIGSAASLAGFGLGYLFLSFFRHFAVSPLEASADPALFLPPTASTAWIILPGMLAMAFCLAGATGSLYLIHRRDKDDFGRDYYVYSLKMACKWALFAALAALAAQGGLFAALWPSVRDLPLRPVFFWGEAGGALALLMACLLWGMVTRNQNPMRLKLHCVAGAILAWLGLTGQMAACARFFLG
ncbi:hypothetical protein NNJEOMEG_03392 [Fundidesulfovibrio magnetotacticus]|uniref:Cytochrome c assembly protein domain-containing protein n=1 Tax=Fundidesulfovibrio magnetotacticus TaxID=2730080 RepID=A0A6V8M0I8_9BACT|nr:hypothetical protein [Fundidesulfovibrio magnetotacticus]GFK95526.1 hypothetical protein NNJEOMEG_03392 [Fundidesulfovibrio magnetotacticus]